MRGEDNLLVSNRIFSNTGSGVGLTTAQYTVVQDNEIYGNDGPGAIQIRNAHAITVTGNRIYSNTTGGGCFCLRSDTITFSGNAVYSNTSTSSDGGAGLVASRCWTVTIEGNTFHHNRAQYRGALRLDESGLVEMVNNVVAENVVEHDGSGIEISGGVVHLLHNSLARNGDGGIHVTGNAQAWLTNTILVSHAVGINVDYGEAHLEGTLWGSGAWANGTNWINNDTLFTGTVNIWGDPAFTDPDDGDYHIGPGSAAIDAGSMPAWPPTSTATRAPWVWATTSALMRHPASSSFLWCCGITEDGLVWSAIWTAAS